MSIVRELLIENIIEILDNRIIEHNKALESLPNIDCKNIQKRLDIMAKAVLVMEIEHKHKGAILELEELIKIIGEQT